MAIIPIVKSLYPKVPAVAGVPTLLRSGAQIFDTFTLGLLDATGLVNSLLGVEADRYSVYDQEGKKIAKYESVVSVRFRDSADVSTYPVERGSFAAYNKVDGPFAVEVVLRCAGKVQDRNDFQSDLRDAKKSLTLYSIVGEDHAFRRANLISIDWVREDVTAGVVEAGCTFMEIRERESAAFSQPLIPGASKLKEQGQLQPIPDTTIDTSGVV